MGVRSRELIEQFNLKPFGQKGWLSNQSIECPACGRQGKFGIKFNDNGGTVHCFFCDYTSSIFKYLKEIGRTDLFDNKFEASITNKIRSLSDEENEVEINESMPVKLPIGLKPLIDDPYLNKRKFLQHHYDHFDPSYTESLLEKPLHNYIIFKIYQKGVLKSWLARSRNTYEWHKENLRKHKLGEEPLVLRYKNSPGTEFDEILGGYDEITDNTTTVILVEGLFDKVGVDYNLDLFKDNTIRCNFTFGNKISDSQIDLLRENKSVKKIILLYDYGTIKQSKTYALKLSKYFNTYVAVPKKKDLDPGDMTIKDMVEVMSTLQTPIEFYVNNLNGSING